MINYHILNNSVIIDSDNKIHNVHKDDARYGKVIECIKNGTLDLIPEIIDVVLAFKKAGIDLIDGVVSIDGQTLPSELSARIVAFKDNDLPFAPLLKFWDKLKANKSYNSRQMLYKFLEHNGHPLTEEGNFIAYRGVTSEFKDCHTGTFDNSVGSTCEIPRESVDDNPNNTCSSGLHVACHSYAEGFGAKLIKVEVNPEDVVCVPTDYDGTKMRVSRFKVLSECENIDTSNLYQYETSPDSQYEIDDYLDRNDECGNCGYYIENDDECYDCGYVNQ